MNFKLKLLCAVSLWNLIQAEYMKSEELPEVNGNKFYYFGYGSNMLTKRIHVQNPTAVKIGVCSLKNFRLDFYTYTSRWNGAPATIVPTDNAIVYGTLWEIDLVNLEDIDNQEGVGEGIYVPISVAVNIDNSTIVTARAYVLLKQPTTEITEFTGNSVPFDRQPSKTYLQCLVKGAIETGIESCLNQMGSKFYYFGFGSNMLAKRIHIQNPTAVRIDAGKLENYCLDFYTQSTNWHGAPATIVPTSGAHVYGAIWEIDCCNMQDLDSQESVNEGIYIPITVPVLSINNDAIVNCRAYHLTNQPTTPLCAMHRDAIPYDRQPSKTYLKTLVKGAIETGIPKEYINWLRSLRHNCKMVNAMETKLELQTLQL